MPLKSSLTGSYPPVNSPDVSIHAIGSEAEQEQIVQEGIRRAVQDQINAGIDILVDGQVRDDIVSLYSWHLPGFKGCSLPCQIIEPIRPSDQPITLADFRYARSLAPDRQFKAHVTGPFTVARSALVDPASGYAGRNDPQLIHDLAVALGYEARALVEAGAEIVQLDEPALQDGVDLEAAFQAMRLVFETGRVPFRALHACGNVTLILERVLSEAPIEMISIEGNWLNHERLAHIDRQYLAGKGKLIGLGCIQVIDYKVDKLTRVQSFLDQMVSRLGEEHIWAAMTNCGMRPLPYEVAQKKLSVLTEAARTV